MRASAFGEYADLLQPGNHGTTFGGNPVAATAALAVIDTIEKDDLLGNATRVGELLRAGLADPRVTEVRGRGLLIGLDLDAEAGAQVVEAAQRVGFIVNSTGPRTDPARPPLVLTEEQSKEFLTAWPGILDTAYASLEGAAT